MVDLKMVEKETRISASKENKFAPDLAYLGKQRGTLPVVTECRALLMPLEDQLLCF
jgi:hypothetical protein